MAIIDVLLPVKNGINFFAEAIESIVNQTYQDWRLIILDHGSTDGSFELANEYAQKDKRVEVCQFTDAVGLSGLLNKGLDLCNCEFVMRHDADDIALPNRMELTLAAFKSHPDIDVIGGHAIKIDAVGDEADLIRVPTDPARLQASFFFKNPMIHPTTMIRFSAIKTMGVRYGLDFMKLLPESQRLVVNGLAEDYYLFGQLGVMGKCMNIDELLIKYRWHGGNVGAKKFMDQIQLSIKISRYLAELFCIQHKLKRFDPAPFCTYGGTVLILPDALAVNLHEQFNQMEASLEKVIGTSTGIRRELAFRSVMTTRNSLCMLFKYACFRLKNTPDLDEWYAVKTWVSRKIKQRQLVSVK